MHFNVLSACFGRGGILLVDSSAAPSLSPLAGGKAIILGRVFNDGRNFSIFNYATFSLQTQISLLQVEVFYYSKLTAETYFR